DLGNGLLHHLSVGVDDKVDHSVGGGVLRAHVEDHFLACGFAELRHHQLIERHGYAPGLAGGVGAAGCSGAAPLCDPAAGWAAACCALSSRSMLRSRSHRLSLTFGVSRYPPALL